jgi:hypothetical protein
LGEADSRLGEIIVGDGVAIEDKPQFTVELGGKYERGTSGSLDKA